MAHAMRVFALTLFALLVFCGEALASEGWSLRYTRRSPDGTLESAGLVEKAGELVLVANSNFWNEGRLQVGIWKASARGSGSFGTSLAALKAAASDAAQKGAPAPTGPGAGDIGELKIGDKRLLPTTAQAFRVMELLRTLADDPAWKATDVWTLDRSRLPAKGCRDGFAGGKICEKQRYGRIYVPAQGS